MHALTRAPGHHWFGYYDKLQFSPGDRYVLGMRTAFEHRTPRNDDRIQIGMVDTAEEDRWIDLGSSTAWGWQQGCKPSSASVTRTAMAMSICISELGNRNSNAWPVYLRISRK